MSASRVVCICWNRGAVALPDTMREAVYADCGRAIECQRDLDAVVEGLERMGQAVPYVCISCAVARLHALRGGHLATIGARRAIAQYTKRLGVTAEQFRDAARRGKAGEN